MKATANKVERGGISLRVTAAAVLIPLNAASIVFGIIFVIKTDFTAFHNVFGAILLLTWTGNAFLVWLNSRAGMGSAAAKKIDLLGSVYLVAVIFAAAGMFAGSFLISSAYSEAFGENVAFYLLLYLSYFGTLALGLALALLSRRSLPAERGAGPAAQQPPTRTAKNAGRFWGRVALFILLVLGFYLAYVLLFSSSVCREPLELLVSQLALFLALLFSSVVILLLKQYRGRRNRLAYNIIAAAGGALCLVFLLPLGAMPSAALKAERDFSVAFGEDWRERIEETAGQNFTGICFSLPAYFLGYPSCDYSVIKDVLYYEGTGGADEGVSLYFDAYLPPGAEGQAQPGKSAVLIRIHGGGWVSGGKGLRNMMQMNKYFASRGYVVFDLQYGLSSLLGEGPGILGAPEHVIGPFIADDMIRHLGIFTRFLEKHAADYGADLDAVFISGGSAGGHLATALTLALSRGAYPELVSPALTVRGVIPFYPGNRVNSLREIGGSPEWLDVEMLVDENSPPCLIYQGSHDGLVPPEVSYSYRDTCVAAGAAPCAVLLMPFGGHASDLGFTGYYNQLFTYYMERFMALYR